MKVPLFTGLVFNCIFYIHSASTKFQDWHYKKYLRERNDTFIV